jgi:hypothetical protein
MSGIWSNTQRSLSNGFDLGGDRDITVDAPAAPPAPRGEPGESPTMNAKRAAITGLMLAVVGAILAFALKSPHNAVAGIELQSLGAVLLATGGLLVAVAGVVVFGSGGSSPGSPSGGVDGLKTIGGLVAVVSAIIGVVALTIVTQSRLSTDKASSIVAIATAAFGVISAMVGAYLGIKVTADQSADAQQQAQSAHAQLGAAKAAAAKAVPADLEDDVKEAMDSAAEDAVKPAGKHRD